MSFPFGWMTLKGRKISRPFVKARVKLPAVDPEGRRLLGLTRDSKQPIWAPKSHSLTLGANGSGKTTKALMPWLFSMLASTDRPGILILDSKDFEIARQCIPMLRELGVPTAIIDDTDNLPIDIHGRVSLNPLDSIVSTHKNRSEDLVFATDAVTQTLIEEPERDERNRYWRAWPRLLTSLRSSCCKGAIPISPRPAVSGCWCRARRKCADLPRSKRWKAPAC